MQCDRIREVPIHILLLYYIITEFDQYLSRKIQMYEQYCQKSDHFFFAA